jgi:hypothetical protein
MHIINVGLETNDGAELNLAAAIAQIAARVRGAVSCGTHQSDTERTLVLVADHVSDGAAYRIAQALRQDCIAVYDTRTEFGRLIGPNAAAWGTFEPAYFVLPSGHRLADSYAAELDAAARGAECAEVPTINAEAYRGE